MKAKTRAENEAEGEVRGSAQMVSCQRPAVPVCVCTFICVCAVHTMHICGFYINVECMSALAFLCASMHVCVSVPSELRRGTVCAQSCSSQMALANRHCKAGGAGTPT